MAKKTWLYHWTWKVYIMLPVITNSLYYKSPMFVKLDVKIHTLFFHTVH